MIDEFYECICGHGIVAMNKLDDDVELCILERRGDGRFGLRTKLDWIWRILRHGRPYEDDLILSKEDALKLGKALVDFAEGNKES